MEILIVGTLLILIAWYLIKTNNSNKLAENKSVFVFTFQTIFKGFTLYSIVGYLLASIIIFYIQYKNGEPHSHNMLELLYLWLSLSGAITGSFIGLILSLLNKVSINKKLILGAILYTIISFIWLQFLTS